MFMRASYLLYYQGLFAKALIITEDHTLTPRIEMNVKILWSNSVCLIYLAPLPFMEVTVDGVE